MVGGAIPSRSAAGQRGTTQTGAGSGGRFPRPCLPRPVRMPNRESKPAGKPELRIPRPVG
jgi:hypothetical protein